ncbi:MAG: hypothetical protein KY432_07840, partial [Acidobacteria bacterium]|nr:hypothetical protein [Acidobacteriota bacterium]
MRLILPILAAIAIVFSVATYRDFAAEIESAEALLEKHAIDQRRPEFTNLVELSHGVGRSGEYIGRAALLDALTPVDLSGADEATRQLWIDSFQNLDDELTDARDAVLDSLVVRPGWPAHFSLTGQLEYQLGKRGEETTLDRWRTPLLLGAYSEGRTFAAGRYLAAAYLEVWPWLPREEREQARAVLRDANQAPEFVRGTLPAAWALMGAEALALLPESSASAGAAIDTMSATIPPAEVARLYRQWEQLELDARKADLEKIREQLRLGDRHESQRLARSWLFQHPFDRFDSPDGTGQVSEALAAIGGGWPEVWGQGLQSRIAEYLLHPRRQPHAEMDSVVRVTERLQGVPDPVRARARLASGDAGGAERLERDSETSGSFEWTEYYLDLARHHFEAGDLQAADEALLRVSPAAAGECDVQLMRERVARGLGLAEAGTLRARLESTIPEEYGPRYWGRGNVLSLCVPSVPAVLEIDYIVEEPVLVAWEIDGARVQTR